MKLASLWIWVPHPPDLPAANHTSVAFAVVFYPHVLLVSLSRTGSSAVLSLT